MTAEALRAVVVDDEPTSRDAILTLLASHDEIVVAGIAANGTEAVSEIRRLKPDLLFLDIEMPDADGFQVLADLGDAVPRGIVFVTAHDEYALRAFDVHALDYVCKPFGKPRFDAAVARAIERLRALDALSLRSTIAAIQRIAVRSGSNLRLINVDDIRWIEASGDYARVYTNEQSHLVDERIGELERTLDRSQFFRIHRSCIVRLECVKELHRESDGGGTIIIGGVRLRVARNRWEPLVAVLHLG